MSLLRFPLLSALIALFLGGFETTPSSAPEHDAAPACSSAESAPTPAATEETKPAVTTPTAATATDTHPSKPDECSSADPVHS